MENFSRGAINRLKCVICGQTLDYGPFYNCPSNHLYCSNCFTELRRKHKGSVNSGCTCVVCKVTGIFTQNTNSSNFLKLMPANSSLHSLPISDLQQKTNSSQTTGIAVTVESLFQLPKTELNKILSNKKESNTYVNNHVKEINGLKKVEPYISSSSSYSQSRVAVQKSQSTLSQSWINSLQHRIGPLHSKVPIRCPHRTCGKMVAISSFVTHFKHEHYRIPKYIIIRGTELCIPCDISVIEHNSHYCLAMITVYEINEIDVKESKSSKGVINTCSKFSQQIPINSFWLMVSGSSEKRPIYSYACCWLFTISEENYYNTIELSSKYDSISFSTFCGVNISLQNKKFTDIVENLDSLIVSHASIRSLLREGPQLNLRITIH